MALRAIEGFIVLVVIVIIFVIIIKTMRIKTSTISTGVWNIHNVKDIFGNPTDKTYMSHANYVKNYTTPIPPSNFEYPIAIDVYSTREIFFRTYNRSISLIDLIREGYTLTMINSDNETYQSDEYINLNSNYLNSNCSDILLSYYFLHFLAISDGKIRMTVTSRTKIFTFQYFISVDGFHKAYRTLLVYLKKIGFKFATLTGSSLTLDMLVVPDSILELKKKISGSSPEEVTKLEDQMSTKEKS
jgi:hypothetical protein